MPWALAPLTAWALAELARRAGVPAGDAPFIIFDDADLDAAADGVVAAKFRNTGQACISANRVLVQAGVYEAFAAKLVEPARKLRVGNGLEADVHLGPLIDDASVIHGCDATRIWRASAAIEAGMIGINCGLISNDDGQSIVASEMKVMRLPA